MARSHSFTSAQNYKLLDLSIGLLWRYGEDRWVFGRHTLFLKSRSTLSLESAKERCEKSRNSGAAWEIWAGAVVIAKGQRSDWEGACYFSLSSSSSDYAFFPHDFYLDGDRLIMQSRKESPYPFLQEDSELNIKDCTVADVFKFFKGYDCTPRDRFFENFECSTTPYTCGEHFIPLDISDINILHYESSSWGSGTPLIWLPKEYNIEDPLHARRRKEAEKTIALADQLKEYFANK